MTHPIEHKSTWMAAPWVPPTAMIGMALLTGSTRLIHWFKGASRGGLLLTAGCASVGTLWYDTHHNNPQNPLAGRSIVIFLGSLASLFAVQPLKGRVSLSVGALCKFTLVEISLVAYSSLESIKNSPRSLLRKKHETFTSHPEKWKGLPIQERTWYVNQFYKYNFSLLPLQPDLSLDLNSLEIELTKPIPASLKQSAWLEEIFLSQDSILIEKLALQDAHWDRSFVKNFFNNHPEIAYLLDCRHFKSIGLDVVTSFRDVIPPLMTQTPAQIRALSRAQIQAIHVFTSYFYVESLNLHQKDTLSARFRSYGLKTNMFQKNSTEEKKSV